jgi:MoaD family protein
MKIRYFATLRDITRRSEQVWNEPTETVQDLLQTLCNIYGPQFRRWVVDESGAFGGLSIVLVNGTDCRELQGMNTQLKSSDVIAIFPPVAGG